MYPRRPFTALLLASLILLMGFAGGCGGGADQSGDQSGDQSEGQQGGEAAKKNSAQAKIALGTVRVVDTETRNIFLRPSTDEQDEQPRRYKLIENATITLDEKKAELSDVSEGQQAQITYVDRKKSGVARKVVLFSADKTTSKDGEKTG